MKTGDSVFHPKYGLGIIKTLASKLGILWASVDFGWAKDTMPVGDLMDSPEGVPLKAVPSLEPTPDVTGQEDKTPTTAPQDAAQLEARKGVNALKLGQVLESNIFRLSVGTQEIETVLNSLAGRAINHEVTPFLIEGAWGGGKTHVLTLLQAIAKKKRMATSFVIMDGHSISLAKPMELIEEITNALQFPFGSKLDSLSHILRRAVLEQQVPQLRKKGANIIAEALSALPQGALDHPDVCHLMEDYFSLSISASQAKVNLSQLGFRASSLPTIKANRIYERPEAFAKLLMNWATFSEVMGASGLLVIFDELDVEYANTAWPTQAAANLRERRRNVLSKLNNLKLLKAPLGLAFASAPGGGNIDPENDAVEDLLKIFRGHIIHVKVPSPNREQLHHLFDKLLGLYDEAFQESSCNLTGEEKSIIVSNLISHYERQPDPVPRQFVRMTLEILDLLCFREKEGIDKVRRLIS